VEAVESLREVDMLGVLEWDGDGLEQVQLCKEGGGEVAILSGPQFPCFHFSQEVGGDLSSGPKGQVEDVLSGVSRPLNK
jgi:hypothetical protein